MSGLNTAQLAIYIILSLPVLYILIRHSWPGIIGWGYLFAFCMLRIVGGALALGKGNIEFAAIISNIGLSPLLLAISGVLHEARHYRSEKGNEKSEWLLVIVYHLLVTTGLALVASGASAFNVNTSNTGDERLIKGGIIILLLAWLVVIVWTVLSFLPSQYNRDTPGYSSGTKILFVVLFAIPFSGIRMLYSVISILAPSANLNPVTGSLGLRIGLQFIPELIVAIALLFVGLATRNIRRNVKSIA